VSPALPIPVVQCLQVATIAGAAPGVSGVISKVEARLQDRAGPRVLQPYYDIAKLFRKEALAPDGSSWVFLAAPLAAMTCYLTVPLLIPVLTTFGLPLRRPFQMLVRAAQRLQSGRLDAYLAYMLIALVAVLAVVTGLR
jgi:formate hydrogenlyase subunit 4